MKLKFLSLLVLLFLSACSSVPVKSSVETIPKKPAIDESPRIGWTIVSGPAEYVENEVMALGLRELPYKIELPSGWSFDESQYSYRIFKGSADTGFLSLLKAPTGNQREGDLFGTDDPLMEIHCTKDFCSVTHGLWNDQFYGIKIQAKNWADEQRSEAMKIIGSILAD